MVTVSALATTLFLGGWHAPLGIDQHLAGRQRGLLAGAVVLRQGPVLHLHLHLAARLAAAAALRPVHGVRLEAADPDLPGLDRRGRHDPRDRAWRGGIDRSYLLIGVGVLAALFLVLFFVGETEEPRRPLPRSPRSRPTPSPAASRSRRCRRAAPVRGAAAPLTFGARHRPSRPPVRRSDGHPQGAVLGPGRRVRGDLPDDVPQGRHRAVPVREAARPPRASTAGTSSTAGPTAWRSASAASCAPGPARPTRSTSRAPPTPRTSGSAPVSATAASTRSTTCAASCAGCASRPARPGR